MEIYALSINVNGMESSNKAPAILQLTGLLSRQSFNIVSKVQFLVCQLCVQFFHLSSEWIC